MDEEMGLFPVVEIPDFAEEGDDYDTEYRPSLSWSLEKGDFVRDTANKIIASDGLEALKVWCVKTVQTERYTCLAYNGDIGTEMEEAVKEEDENAVELAMERTITEAVKVNPRVEAVEDFDFSWGSDAVKVSFKVAASGWEDFPIEITLKRAEVRTDET